MDDKTTTEAVTIYITNKICPQDIFKIHFTQYYNNNSVALLLLAIIAKRNQVTQFHVIRKINHINLMML